MAKSGKALTPEQEERWSVARKNMYLEVVKDPESYSHQDLISALIFLENNENKKAASIEDNSSRNNSNKGNGEKSSDISSKGNCEKMGDISSKENVEKIGDISCKGNREKIGYISSKGNPSFQPRPSIIQTSKSSFRLATHLPSRTRRLT